MNLHLSHRKTDVPLHSLLDVHLQLLADRLVVLRLVDAVSKETVRQALKKTT